MGKSLKSQESGSRILGEYRLTDISLSLGDLSGLSQISSILVRYLGRHGIAGDRAVSGGKSWGLAAHLERAPRSQFYPVPLPAPSPRGHAD